MSDITGAAAAIRSRFASAWAETKITYQNEPPPDPMPPVDAQGWPVPWVHLEIVHDGSEMVGAGMPGAQVFRYDGWIYLHAFVPLATGTAEAMRLAVAAGEIYRNAVFYNSGDGCYVRTWAPSIGTAETGDDSGAWFRATASVPFEYYHRG